MTDAPAAPPPAWYPDPEVPRQQRYWDGTTWTEHVAPSVVTTPPTNGHGGTSATFGQRLGALLIDVLIMTVLLGLLIGIMVVIGYLVGAVSVNGDGGLGVAAGVFVIILFILGLAILILAPLAYGAGFEGPSGGQTIGKWALGIRVINPSGTNLTLGRSFGRQAVKVFASGQVLYLGYLWMLFDDQDRTWHDMAVTSLVVVDPGPKRGFGDLVRSFSLSRAAS